VSLALVVAAAVVVAPASGLAGETGDAQSIALEMIKAHGGMDRWKAVTTVSFKNTMVAPWEPDDPWVSIEVTEQNSRRTYQDWPLDGATIVSDGKVTWSKDWKRGNPPKFMVNLSYYFLNLPWITQDPGVKLEGPGQGKLPGGDETYTTIRMTFEPGVGEASDDYYVIFIDPETKRMKAVEYIVTYGAMLDLFNVPEDQTFVGPLINVFDEYATVGGLAFPVKYTTYSPDGDVYGQHTVENLSLDKPFDETRMKMPDDAVVDNSSAKRKQ
jgi:hypothetical protein